MPVLGRLFDAGVVLEAGSPTEVEGVDLHPEEQRAIEDAVEKRRREYATARGLAHKAFSVLGLESRPLLNREDRSPIWPEGVVGSLTHTDGLCVVVVARKSTHLSLGIDAEREQRVDRSLFERVLTERERSWLGQLPEEQHGRIATLLFSAKESLYKCQFPLTERFLGFHDVELELDLPAQRFTTRFLLALDGLPRAEDLSGRFEYHQGHVVTAVACRAGSTLAGPSGRRDTLGVR